MAGRLMLICQGATAATRRSAFPSDEPLDEQARFAAGTVRLSGYIERGWVSPTQAARQTAEAISVDCREDPELRNLDCGRWAGRTIDDVAGKEPDGLARWLNDPGFEGHGGESIARFLKRTGSWLERRAEERGRTVAVTDAGVVRGMIIHVLSAPPEAFWRIDIVPLSQTVLSHDGRRWALRSCGHAA